MRFKNKFQVITNFLKSHNMPSEIQNKANNYFNYLWETRKGFDTKPFKRAFVCLEKRDKLISK